MINPPLVLRVVVYALLSLHFVLPAQTHAQAASKAIVMAWDGTVSSFVKELIREGKLPNLAKLIAGGTFADDVIAGYPSKTAPGFASLMTGAPPRVTGISGNRVPRAPREQFTILDSLAGFAGAPLRAEPIWAAARRAGKKSVVSHIPSFAEERAEDVARFWHQIVTLHHRKRTLSRELKEAERALGTESIDANFARLKDVQNRLAALDGTEALLEGFGEPSGRPARTM